MGEHCPICKKDWLECDCPYVDGLQAPLVDWDNGHLVLMARGATFCSVRELYVSHEKLRAHLAAANAVVEAADKTIDALCHELAAWETDGIHKQSTIDRREKAILKYRKLQGGDGE